MFNNPAIDISIEVNFSPNQGPRAYGVDSPSAMPLIVGDFIGQVAKGGSCNCFEYKIIPHCHGTHTETVGHILVDDVPVSNIVTGLYLQDALLITVTPHQNCTENYQPQLTPNDLVISKKSLLEALGGKTPPKALVIRTLPNSDDKTCADYSKVTPAFFTNDAMELIAQYVEHLVTDIPSVDCAWDDGNLSNHRIYWNVAKGVTRLSKDVRTHALITEMVYIPNEVEDGEYKLLTQVPRFLSDAAPSRLSLFKS
jgi:arylformamidase